MLKQKHKICLFILILMTSALLFNNFNINVFAENPYNTGNLGRELYGGSYWTTSNIREWLNSDKTTVGYTNNPPSLEYLGGNAYDKEAGFLNNFSTKEKNAIAVTERREILSNLDSEAKEGGGGGTGHTNIFSPVFLANYDWFAFNYKNYGYKKTLDKVFLLTPFECYWYLNRRGYDYARPLTEQAIAKHNTSSISNWWLQGNTIWMQYDFVYMASNNSSNKNLIRSTNANAKNGIVPAINIKPNYVFDNGKIASSLKIGDKIVFGKYLNAPIEWQVINISDTGYPLLLSTKVLDLKVYDAKGDQSKRYSEHINFDKADVSLFNDVQYKSTSMDADVDVPTVTIHNKELLSVRQNNSFTLDIEVTDPSGIEYIIKPDGTKTTNTRFTYTATKNGQYVVKTMDKKGNYNEYLIPVSNVNAEPFVNVKPSTTDWTNKDVNIDISTSNDVKWSNSYMSLVQKQGVFGSPFPNYTSYMGKTFNVKGTVKLIHYDDRSINSATSIGFYYRTKSEGKNTFNVRGSWNGVYSIPIRSMIGKGEIPFEFNWTVPGNYFDDLKPWINPGGDSIYPNSLRVEITDLQYTLLDDSDFKINSITLPNGNVINSSSYTDVISKEGISNLTYSVLDNRGKITKKDVQVKIDKTLPTANIEYDNSPAKEVLIKVTSNDALSGVKRIKLPNGNYTNGSIGNYIVKNNGSYEFLIEDLGGNILSKTVTIDNIDLTSPIINISGVPDNWTSEDVKLKVTSSDNLSGVKNITLPNGNIVNTNETTYTISSNGSYTIKSKDNLDNEGTLNFTIDKIDKTNPAFQVNKEIASNKLSGFININLSDIGSGIDYLLLPNSTKVYDTLNYKYPISNNGYYGFSVYDKVGNRTNINVEVSELLTNINPSGTDRIEYKLEGATVQNWTTYNSPFAITNEGITTIRARVYDKAGNLSDERISVVKIDKTKPINNSIIIQLK